MSFSKILLEDIKDCKNYKSQLKKFTFIDAVRVLNNPNLKSLVTQKPYQQSTIKKYIADLRALITLLNCRPDADLITCFKNVKSVKNVVMEKGYSNYKDYMKLPILLANASVDFAVLLGKRALNKYKAIPYLENK